MGRRVFLILGLVTLFSGCGNKSEPLVVKGNALYRGYPLSGGTITFCPNSERGYDGPILQATIQDDGSFQLQPLDGVTIRPGWYRIAVAPRAGSQSFPSAENPYPGLPIFFRNPILSGLEKEVKDGKENFFHIDLGDS